MGRPRSGDGVCPGTFLAVLPVLVLLFGQPPLRACYNGDEGTFTVKRREPRDLLLLVILNRNH